MNVVLSDAVQVKEGSNEPATKFGKILIRGSQILGDTFCQLSRSLRALLRC
jgi:hypothetical protein